MAGQHVEATMGGRRVDEVHGAVGHPLALAGSAFALGVVVGMFLKTGAKQMQERAEAGLWHREYERTATYDENLPDSLERREPAPHEGQPRYGGTGAIGVPPATVTSARAGDTTARDKA